MTSPLIVLGSANRDYTVRVERHPQPGETVLGGAASVATGGKGANQAAAAARAGVTPVLVGAVGADSVGDDILSDLSRIGVDTSHVVRAPHATGIALITVAGSGENTIVVAPGANGELDETATTALIAELSTSATVLLAQLEVPIAVVSAAALAVEAVGGRFVLNLSPSQYVSPHLLALADPLVVNETEASDLASSIIDSPADAMVVAARLQATSRSVVLTLGGDGVVVASADGVQHLPAEPATVVDTTGAGDAFAGALAASLASDGSLADAVSAGIAAGAQAVQYEGAQPR